MRTGLSVRLLTLAVAFSTIAGMAFAQSFETKAPHVYMVESATGTVLFSKAPDAKIPPASLAKLMTMEVVFNGLRTGELSMNDTYVVSENAWRTGGAPSGTSTMFAALKSEIRLEDLIQGVIVQQANDGCIIIAEGSAGSEDSFAKQMTERAASLGLQGAVFKNSTGLPAEGQSVTVKDLAKLGEHIWRTYPDYFKYYAQPEFTWNKITQRNRNPLLTMGIGADGMGLGFTEGSGYAIVASVNTGGRRIFVAMSGMASEKERAEEARRIIEWATKSFGMKELFAAGETVGEAQVYGGEKGGVSLTGAGPISILVPSENPERLIARIVYEGPVVAPVEKGAQIGALRVWIGDTMSQETPLFAAESVAVGSLSQRALDAIGELLIGWLR